VARPWILDHLEMPDQLLDGHAPLPYLGERRSPLVEQRTGDRGFMRRLGRQDVAGQQYLGVTPTPLVEQRHEG